VEVLRANGEPVFTVDTNPTAERIAELIFDTTHRLGFNVTAVRVWETPASCATYAPATRSTPPGT